MTECIQGFPGETHGTRGDARRPLSDRAKGRGGGQLCKALLAGREEEEIWDSSPSSMAGTAARRTG
jgi:hypothetical protein